MKTNVDYQKGKIVGIYDKQNELIYITSTIMDIDQFSYEDIMIENYTHHEHIRAPISV